MERARGTRIQIGPFEVDQTAHELSRDGVRVPLQEKQFQLLTVFLQRPDEVITREELRKALWPTEQYGEFDIGLNQAVRRLRRALGDSARHPKWIETLPRIGYRFIGPAAVPVNEEGKLRSKSRLPRISWSLFAVVVGLVVVMAAVWGYTALFGPSVEEGVQLDPASMTSMGEHPCQSSC